MRRLTVRDLTEKRNEGINKLLNLRYERPAVGKVDNAIISTPGSTAESVGLLHCEIVAELNAIENAIKTVNDVYRKLTSPASEKDDDKIQEDYY